MEWLKTATQLFVTTCPNNYENSGDSLSPTRKYRLAVIGAGILGLSIALDALRRVPGIDVIVFEKENVAGSHASGRNSGVIHAGLYYQKNSMKADFAVRGNTMMRRYMQKHNLPMLEIGKVIVAKNKTDLGNLDSIYSKGIESKANVQLLDASELHNYEPLAMTYKKFLWSPGTAVGSPHMLIKALEDELSSLGATITYGSIVSKIVDSQIRLENGEEYTFDHLVNCAGTGALRIAYEQKLGLEYMQLPVSGGYLSTKIENLPLRRLVYSAPHPLSPFLGVHFTQTLDSRIRVGPSAVPLLGSEQYLLQSKVSLKESLESLNSLVNIVRKNPSYASKVLINQLRAGTKRGMLNAAKELVPITETNHGWVRDPAGIRAQLVNRSSGKLVDDFVIQQTKNSTHILNVVSPGWTSSFPFAQYVVNNIIARDFPSYKEN